MLTRRIETLSTEQCRELLDSADIGRVVFTDRGLPAVLPVNFVVDGNTVVLRTAEGSRLARAADDAVLGFEADDVHAVARTGWSVVVTGQAYLEQDPAERARLSDLIEPWVPGIKDAYVRIPLTVLTGRRVTAG